ncbi:hydroquinone glucosyltransferase [Salvia divinorum]|uniref:Glycosyltransferase n=1 Tax=Salvia divinorum TaxID=28513 RepID=A0ABD1H589_SALDI
MSADGKKTLVFIPLPTTSHLVSAVGTAKLLADRDDRLSITILIMTRTPDTKISSYTTKSPHPRINFLYLQEREAIASGSLGDKNWALSLAESHKCVARDVVVEMMESQKGRLAGIVIDMFCTPMIDVANELGAPAYIYFSSGSAFLGLLFHLQSLRYDHGKNMKEYEDSDVKISVQTYVNPVPAKLWPGKVFDNETGFLESARRFRETRGIIVNTFLEFEPHAISSLSADDRIPPVYPVGPMIQGGRFQGDQVTEIATALENSGVRFLWSLRKPSPKESVEFPGEYENLEQELPEGFLRNTTGIGKVIGWAPQMAVLSHPAVGGFVSHCGWNSTLESVWCGVPVAAWPLFAEQHVNAFQLLKEFEMAVEIKIDYRKESGVIVAAGTIESAIRQLMDPENKIRLKVKELHDKSRAALVEGGSSYNFLGRLLENVMDNAH